MAERFQPAGERRTDTVCISEDDPACGARPPADQSRSGALAPGNVIEQPLVVMTRHDFLERQPAQRQAFQLGHRPPRRIVDRDVDDLRTVHFDAAQPGVHPRRFDPVLVEAVTCERDGKVGATASPSCSAPSRTSG